MNRMFRNTVLFLSVLIAPFSALAQQDSTVEWKTSLQNLEHRLAGLSNENAAAVQDWRAEAEDLRASLASFAISHPAIALDVPKPLPENPSVEILKQQFDKLTPCVDQVIKESPGSPFHLGTQTVVVEAQTAPPAPVEDSIDHAQIDEHDFVNIAKAYDYLPGVEIEHIAGRNEAGLRVRGFTTRGQVPFYLDDIPISVPYDGYVDFNRFLTSDIAELQVTKGYSSPLMGPNAEGGTVNLVTVEPVEKFEGEALIGTGSRNTLLSSLRLGTRWQHFFVQDSLDWLQADFVPLSGNLQVLQYANLPNITMTDNLNHSGTQDARYGERVGWMPRAGDEYVVSVTNQRGVKGVPLYQGPNTADTFSPAHFWTWPYWIMNSYAFHSVTGLGEKSFINFRMFYNQFKNAINMYPTDLYVFPTTTTSPNAKNAEHSVYDDHTDGASTDLTSRSVTRNVLSGSFFFKDDAHKEYGVYPGRNPLPLITATVLDRDQQASIGLQDVITISSRLQATAGFSADHFDGLQGETYNSALTGTVPFTCVASPTNTSVAGCTLHAWNFNPQAALSYQVESSGNLFVTFADRGRFPMLKDIYSASLGAGLPNPDLQPEHSRNWNVGYAHHFSPRTLAQVVLYRSDLRNAIESVYVTDPGGPATPFCPNTKIKGYCSEMVNIGQEVHQGVELELRSNLFSRLTVDGSYSYLNRSITYNFASDPNVSQVNTSILILPTLPKNKLVGTASLRLPHQVLAIVSARFEGGLRLQDTTYSPIPAPFSESFGTMDINTIVPVYQRFTVQAGIKNLLDRNYYYTAGYPEEGRNWFLNLRYQF